MYYRLICRNRKKQITYYRWYTTIGSLDCALSLIKQSKKRDVRYSDIAKVSDGDYKRVRLDDLQDLALKSCKQCGCSHNDGNESFCGKCLKHPYAPRPKLSPEQRQYQKAINKLKRTAKNICASIEKATKKLNEKFDGLATVYQTRRSAPPLVS